MPITTSQNNFKNHLNDYLDQVNTEGETVLIARPKQRFAAVISREHLNALLDAVRAKEGSLEAAIARDKLVEMHFLPDDPIVNPNDDYWNHFRERSQFQN